jgi:hypothetical protein
MVSTPMERRRLLSPPILSNLPRLFSAMICRPCLVFSSVLLADQSLGATPPLSANSAQQVRDRVLLPPLVSWF